CRGWFGWWVTGAASLRCGGLRHRLLMNRGRMRWRSHVTEPARPAAPGIPRAWTGMGRVRGLEMNPSAGPEVCLVAQALRAEERASPYQSMFTLALPHPPRTTRMAEAETVATGIALLAAVAALRKCVYRLP